MLRQLLLSIVQPDKYNAHQTIALSVDPESVKGLDERPDFYLISNQENATSLS